MVNQEKQLFDSVNLVEDLRYKTGILTSDLSNSKLLTESALFGKLANWSYVGLAPINPVNIRRRIDDVIIKVVTGLVITNLAILE